MRSGTFARAGYLLAIAMEFGHAFHIKPVPGGVVAEAEPETWALVLRELEIELEDPALEDDYRAYFREMISAIREQELA